MKKIISCIIIIMLSFTLCSCDDIVSVSKNAYKEVEQETTVDSALSFKTLATYGTYKIVYNEKTKVMYSISYGNYNFSAMTLLVNADGTPMLWE